MLVRPAGHSLLSTRLVHHLHRRPLPSSITICQQYRQHRPATTMPRSDTTKAQPSKATSTSTRLSSLNGGPSPFPRRMPVASPKAPAAASSSASFSSSSPSLNNSTTTARQEADSMARKLTRFYTANFERRPVITLCVTNSILSTIGDAAAQLIPIIGAAAGAPVPGWDFERTLRFAMFGFSVGPMIEKWNRFLEYRFPLRPVSEVFEGELKPDEDPNSPAFIEKLKKDAEKEGFRVNIDRGDSDQGQQYASKSALNIPSNAHRRGSSKSDSTSQNNINGSDGSGSRIVDPQHIAMPNTGGQPGQISVVALFKRVFADQLFMAPLGIALFISTMAILEGLEWDDIMERYKKMFIPILLVNWQIWPFVQIINFRYLPLRYRVPFSASLGVLWTVFLSIKNAKATAPKVA